MTSDTLHNAAWMAFSAARKARIDLLKGSVPERMVVGPDGVESHYSRAYTDAERRYLDIETHYTRALQYLLQGDADGWARAEAHMREACRLAGVPS